MSRTKIFSRAGAVAAAVAVASFMFVGCEDWNGRWGGGGGGGGGEPDVTYKAVYVGQTFTLGKNGSARLVEPGVDLIVNLEGWMICPENAMCEVQNHVIWSVKIGDKIVRPSYMSHDGCVCVVEIPPYKIEMTGTDWKREASFRIVSDVVDCRNKATGAFDGCVEDPPAKEPKDVFIGEEFTLSKNGSARLIVRGTSLSVHLEGWSICPEGARCIVPDRVIWSVNMNGEIIESNPAGCRPTGWGCSIEASPYKVELMGTDWKYKASFKITFDN